MDDGERAALAMRLVEIEDEVLITRLRSGVYSDDAREVVLEVLAGRGVDMEQFGNDAIVEAAGEDGSDELVAVARFTAPVDAQLLAGCLEASGIPVFLGNVDTAHALGYMGAAVPIVVRVPGRLAAEARAVMAAVEAGEFALDEDVDPGDANP
ncbi:MAG: putative signal transducing protein [Arenimonas sp.]